MYSTAAVKPGDLLACLVRGVDDNDRRRVSNDFDSLHIMVERAQLDIAAFLERLVLPQPMARRGMFIGNDVERDVFQAVGNLARRICPARRDEWRVPERAVDPAEDAAAPNPICCFPCCRPIVPRSPRRARCGPRSGREPRSQ